MVQVTTPKNLQSKDDAGEPPRRGPLPKERGGRKEAKQSKIQLQKERPIPL
jgi:hypothetical protein